jgi:hypothetical protein
LIDDTDAAGTIPYLTAGWPLKSERFNS